MHFRRWNNPMKQIKELLLQTFLWIRADGTQELLEIYTMLWNYLLSVGINFDKIKKYSLQKMNL